MRDSSLFTDHNVKKDNISKMNIDKLSEKAYNLSIGLK